MSDEYQLSEGIAVVGMAGRFPGADDLDAYWANLRSGVESITTFDRAELLAGGVDPDELDAPGYVPKAGAVEGVDLFDAAFFGFNPREAEILDPHHRLFLEHAWAALESAGYDPSRTAGAVGVYGGMSATAYLTRNLYPNREILAASGDLQLRIYTDKDFLASLASYKLDLTGPSMTVQSACSTSLVAASLACQALTDYQCDMALAGGVCLSIPPKAGYFAHEGVFAPSGHCRAFDAGAQGTVAGSGVGVVVLKRLGDALRDGDTVRAVIRGWGVNNDGGLKLGYTTPSQDGQAEVVALAQAVAGVDASTVTYIETHGTGTPLGDQVEIAALTDVFRDATDETGFCAVGSVKTNIGHLDAAAGVASLAKTVLALEHGELPPSLHFERPNPAIDFASGPFYVNAELAPWTPDGPRRAGVSAFAVGGVNAHLVLEEAPAAGRRPRSGGGGDAGDGPQLLVLSARTSDALDAATQRLADALDVDDPAAAPPLADVAHTLAVGRKAFEHRRAVVARDRAHAVELLRGGEPRRLLTGRAPGGRRPVAFLFPGLGNHSVGMARELYDSQPVFAGWIDRAAEVLSGTGEMDLVASLYPPESSDEAGSPAPDLKSLLGGGAGASSQDAAGELLRTRLAQPALFAVEHALAQLWISWGVEPAALMGYSIGEYVAATLAGVFRFEDAVTLVAERARRIDALPEGAMLAVPLSEDDTRALLVGPFAELDVSAVNTPEVTVVAGPADAIEALDARLSQRFGARSAHRRLATSHAFHSRQVEPVADELRSLVASFDLSAPKIPLVSNVTGTWMEGGQATDPGYWARHLTAPVRAADGLARLLEGPEERVLLEVGPGQALSSWALQLPAAAGDASRVAVSSLPHAFDRRPDREVMLSTLGRLWLAGVDVGWTAVGGGEDARRRRVPLPTYPFERRRYWVDPPERAFGAFGAIGGIGAMAGTATPRAASGDTGGEPFETKRPNPADWLTVRTWREVAPVPNPATSGGACLVLGWPAGLLPPLAGALEAAGREVVLAAPAVGADRFERLDEGAYLVDPASAESWRALLDDLDARELSPELVVHALALGDDGSGDDGPGEDGMAAFWSLLALGKTLALAAGEGDGPRRLEIAVLGSGLGRVADGERVLPERATLMGPAAVLPQEIPGVACRVLDVTVGAADPAVVAELVAADLSTVNPEPGEPRVDDHLVAWRGRRRYLPEHVPLRLRAGAPEASRDTPPTYLITGGTGGIGLVMAEELARTLRARVALLARSPVPPRDEWEGIVDGATGDAATGNGGREKLARLLEIERLGAEVLVLEGDVTDRASLEAAVETVHDRFGPVHGVLHAAGVYPGGMVMAKTREAAAEVLAPKMAGTENLHAVLGDEIESMVLFSSLTAELGGFGLVDHAAANAYLDAFAEARADEVPYRLVSVAWDTWLSVGQAAEAARRYHLAPEAADSELDGDRGDRDADPREPVRPVDHPLVTVGLLEEGPERALYRTRLDPAHHWVMDEHRLDGAGLLPGTGAVELLAAVARDRFGLDVAGGSSVALERVVFAAPVLADDGAPALLDVEVTGAPESGHLRITLVGRSDPRGAGGRVEHLRAEARADVGRPDVAPLAEVAGRIDTAPTEPASGGQPREDEGREEGVSFGPRWRGLGRESGRGHGHGDGEALARFELTGEHRGDLERYVAHPALLDAATGFVQEAAQGTFLPAAIERIALHRPLPASVWSHVTRLSSSGTTVVADLVLYGAGDDPTVEAPVVAEIEGFTLRRLDPDRPAAGDAGAARGDEALAASVLEGIEPAEGAEVLRRLLAAPWLPPRLSVSTRPFPQVLAAARRTAGAALLGQLQELTGRAGGATHERPDLPTAYVAPRSDLESDLERLWRDVLGLDRVGVNDDFFDLGGDSLLATRMLGLLEERFGVRLGLAAVFEASTVGRLAGAVVEAQAAEVDEDELAQALDEIRDLDPETLKALLAQEADAAEEGDES